MLGFVAEKLFRSIIERTAASAGLVRRKNNPTAAIYNPQTTKNTMSEPSKYSQNQFLTATEDRLSLMGEVLADTRPRLALAQSTNAGFTAALASLDAAIALWNPAETARANAEAALPAATYSLTDKLASLTRKPDADTNSLLEGWDVVIRGQVAYQGPVYDLLLPSGRETLTDGTIEDQLDAGRDFGLRLAAQVTKPTLVSLGTTVTTFYNAARALRTAQVSAKAAIDTTITAQEPIRLQAAAALYAMVGTGMTLWSTTPERVDDLFNVNLLRGSTLDVPGAPADTAWTPGTRTLTTTALPAGATRLEAWREGPGGAPELLAFGEPGALSVVIPAHITFDAGDLYQLWLQARNGQGTSPAGPKQAWVAA